MSTSGFSSRTVYTNAGTRLTVFYHVACPEDKGARNRFSCSRTDGNRQWSSRLQSLGAPRIRRKSLPPPSPGHIHPGPRPGHKNRLQGLIPYSGKKWQATGVGSLLDRDHARRRRGGVIACVSGREDRRQCIDLGYRDSADSEAVRRGRRHRSNRIELARIKRRTVSNRIQHAPSHRRRRRRGDEICPPRVVERRDRSTLIYLNGVNKLT